MTLTMPPKVLPSDSLAKLLEHVAFAQAMKDAALSVVRELPELCNGEYLIVSGCPSKPASWSVDALWAHGPKAAGPKLDLERRSCASLSSTALFDGFDCSRVTLDFEVLDGGVQDMVVSYDGMCWADNGCDGWQRM